MDFEGLAELLVPLTFFFVVGGLVGLRMLRPYADRILELIREMQEDRHQALAETRDLQSLRDRIDMLAERQDFLESLVERRLDESEQAELERIRGEEIDPSAGLRSPDLASRARSADAGKPRGGTAGGEGAGGEEGSGASAGDAAGGPVERSGGDEPSGPRPSGGGPGS